MKLSYPRTGWECGRWFFRLSFGKCWTRYQMGWTQLDVAVLKVHTQPGDGEQITRGYHYRGFWVVLHVWLPFEVEQWR